MKKLAIGTAQFGLDYGVSNTSGKTQHSTVKDILNRAIEYRIKTLDTAIVYGDSEVVLGNFGVGGFRIVTKLPPLPSKINSIEQFVVDNLKSSLKKLKVDKVYGLMLHKSEDFLGVSGLHLFEVMSNLKKSGVIDKIGVSIYSPNELDALDDSGISVDIVQAPFNIFDRCLYTSGWMKRLKSRGVEIHVRSIFLQGLLLLKAKDRNKFFLKWKEHFFEFDSWIERIHKTPLEACVNFVDSYEDIDHIIVGVENSKQLEEIVSSLNSNFKISVPDNLQSNDSLLINPSNWKL